MLHTVHAALIEINVRTTIIWINVSRECVSRLLININLRVCLYGCTCPSATSEHLRANDLSNWIIRINAYLYPWWLRNISIHKQDKYEASAAHDDIITYGNSIISTSHLCGTKTRNATHTNDSNPHHITIGENPTWCGHIQHYYSPEKRHTHRRRILHKRSLREDIIPKTCKSFRCSDWA